MRLHRPPHFGLCLMIAASLFMEHLDGSIIATALPAMAKDYQADPLHLNLAITSYLFSVAIFIPISGWMADRWGTRKVFCAATLLFTLSSALCAVAPSIHWLVLGRALQGMGGSMTLPVGRLVLMRTVKKEYLVDALSWIAIPSLIGPIIGPPLGGFIVTYFSWPWIFLINLPIGLAGAFFAYRLIPDYKSHETLPRFDIKGFFLLALSMASLIFSFETVGRGLIPTWLAGVLFGIGCIGLAAYVRASRQTDQPLLDMKAFASRCFSAGTIGGGIFRTGVSSISFLLPMMFQVGFGLSALKSGLLSFATAAGACTVKAVAAPLLHRFGFRTIMIASTVASAIIIFVCGFLTPTTPKVLIIGLLVMGGWAWSLQFSALHSIAFADIPAPRMGSATALFSVIQQLTRGFGVATASMVLGTVLLITGRQDLEAGDFFWAFASASLLALSSSFFFIRLHPSDGQDLMRKKPRAAQQTTEAIAESGEE